MLESSAPQLRSERGPVAGRQAAHPAQRPHPAARRQHVLEVVVERRGAARAAVAAGAGARRQRQVPRLGLRGAGEGWERW